MIASHVHSKIAKHLIRMVDSKHMCMLVLFRIVCHVELVARTAQTRTTIRLLFKVRQGLTIDRVKALSSIQAHV